jgi:hypothetical protein
MSAYETIFEGTLSPRLHESDGSFFALPKQGALHSHSVVQVASFYVRAGR